VVCVSRGPYRRTALALLLVLAAGAAVSQASHYRAKAPACSLHGSRTLYRDASVRVYAKDSADGEDTYYYACLFSANRRVRIETGGGPADPYFGTYVAMEHLHAAPPFIAVHFIEAQKGTAYTTPVQVIDLRTGKKRLAYSVNPVTGVGLTARGSVAWMYAGTTFEVHKLDAGAKDPVLLDSGPEVDGTSFAVGGTHVYWRNAGVTRAATMP
jgi:hypothetical protein